ncbi:MAG: DUF971 domain-containing protein [bacterium]
MENIVPDDQPPPELPKNNDNVDLSWTPDGKLRVKWLDTGVTADFSVLFLRRACPCAHCRMLPHDENGLNRGLYPANLRVTEVKFVGRYGINPIFSDGHGYGIFSYENLSKLAPLAG